MPLAEQLSSQTALQRIEEKLTKLQNLDSLVAQDTPSTPQEAPSPSTLQTRIISTLDQVSDTKTTISDSQNIESLEDNFRNNDDLEVQQIKYQKPDWKWKSNPVQKNYYPRPTFPSCTRYTFNTTGITLTFNTTNPYYLNNRSSI